MKRSGPRPTTTTSGAASSADTFFGEQADWCAKYNIEYLVHLNHEETMTGLVRSEGDYLPRQPLCGGAGNR